MRVCQSCGRENPDDRDFCECGEYLRWEPTNYVPAVSAPASEPAATGEAPAAGARSERDGRGGCGGVGAGVGCSGGAGRAGFGGRAEPGTPGSGDAPPGAAALMLRLPDDDSAAAGPVRVLVDPGEGVVIVGLIRNQSEVVDNFDLSVRGLPEDWWTISPATAYLVPYGSGGTYEQEIQIQIHPPRSPQSQARPWPFEVVAESRAYGGEVASSSATATVGPYFDVAHGVAPRARFGSVEGSLPADRAQQGERAHGGRAQRRGHRCRVRVPFRRAEDRAGAGERDGVPVHGPAAQAEVDRQAAGPPVPGHGRAGRRRHALAAADGGLPPAAVAAVVARDRRARRSPRWPCSRSS